MKPITRIACLYIDFDAFFANVEKQLDASIQNAPVGVTSLPSEHATLITRCYQAKEFGVKRGMRVFEARELCPDLVIRPARHDVYVQVHQTILATLNRFVPVTKAWSIDEMECQLMRNEGRNAVNLSRAIKTGLAETVGPIMTASIGLSANQFLAKVAAEMNKPDGLTVLHPKDLPGPLLDLALRDLPGVANGMAERLERAGIHDMQALWDVPPKHMRKIWGNVEGERMWAQLHGYEVSRPETTRRMFGHSRILSRDWKTADKALDCLRLLTTKAAYRMRREGYTASAMSISLRTKTDRWQQAVNFPACDDDHTLSHVMGTLFEIGIKHVGHHARIERVGVMLFDILKKGHRSGDLFEDTHVDPSRSKWQNATQIMDQLNEKHGRRVIQLGPKVEVPGGYAGAKIAFGRVPDQKDFF